MTQESILEQAKHWRECAKSLRALKPAKRGRYAAALELAAAQADSEADRWEKQV